MAIQKELHKVLIKSGITAFLLFFLCVSLQAQNNTTIDVNQLSEEGQKHYDVIESLKFGSAFLGGEGLAEEKIIRELEIITQTDPNYAPVFYQLGARCVLYGKEFGEPFFTKAEEAFRKYGILTGVSVEDHYFVINALRNEYGNGRR